MKQINESQEMVVCILAGGQGKRLKQDKAYVKLKNKRLIDIALDKALKISSNVVVSSGKRTLIIRKDIMQIKDKYGKGPIAGIYSTLLTFNRALFFPVDMPFLPIELLTFLWEEGQKYDVLVCQINQKLQPLVGVYSNSIVNLLKNYMDKGNYSLTRFLNTFKSKMLTKIITESMLVNMCKDLKSSFLNINTKEDLERAIYYENV